MLKIWQKANAIIAQLKNDLGTLVTKDEKLALLDEAEKIIGSNGIGLFADLVIEPLKAEVVAQP